MTTNTIREYQGDMIYVIYDIDAHSLKAIEPGTPVSKATMVMPMYWQADAQIYVTVPGTEFYGKTPDGFEFYNLSNARGFIEHTIQPGKWQIVKGPDGHFWVVTNREAAKLIKLGYQPID